VYRDNIAHSAPVQRVAYRTELDYSTPARHEVVKTDFIDGTEEVIYSTPIHNDSAYVDHLDGDVMIDSEVAYTAPANVSYVTPAANLGVAYVAARNAVNPCTPFEPTEPCSGAVARTVSYGTADYNNIDFEDQAFLDTDDVTYVADSIVEDACLSPVSYYEAAPVVTTRVVSHIPTTGVVYDSFDRDIEPVFVDDAAPPTHDMSVADVDLVDNGSAYVASDNCSVICAEDEAGFDTVSNVEDVDSVDTMPVTYVPVETVQYVPVETVRVVPVEYVDADDCDAVVTTSGGFAEYDPMMDNNVYYSDSSGQFVSFDDSFADMDVDDDVYFDPHLDNANAEFYSDVGYV
jgi:hypothetical protein